MMAPRRGGMEVAKSVCMWQLIKQSVSDFLEDDCQTMAAALAYYTVFSLPPLLVVIVTLAGFFLGAETVREAVLEQAASLVGPRAAEQVQVMLSEGGAQTEGAWWKVLMGLGVLLFGATTAFAQLQAALNRAWEVEPDPNAGGARQFIGKRILSFGFVLALGFLLLVSMVLSAVLTGAGNWVAGRLGGLSGPLLEVLNLAVSLVIITALFAAIFKYLPDARIAWEDVRTGAMATGFLFVVGKFLIGLYIGKSGLESPYGAAGAIILIFVWVYYSSMILLFGAELTQVWAERHGRRIEPEAGARKMAAAQPGA
ncbi:MAG: YihY/virulence factor BrkB family protein [Bryobacterales bacterium]|nr:YihY/virulence factor BrkB family protein [Bryobacterales bacterium]